MTPEVPGSPVRFTFMSPPIGMTPVIGRPYSADVMTSSGTIWAQAADHASSCLRTRRSRSQPGEVLHARGELEVAAVVDRAGVRRFPARARPAGRTAVAPERVDDEVAPYGIALAHRHAGCPRA